MKPEGGLALLPLLAEFPLFVLRAFTYPRSLVRNLDFGRPESLQRLALYAVLWLALLVLAYANADLLSKVRHAPLSTFKGIVMRAHDRSWEPFLHFAGGGSWGLASTYSAFNMDRDEAKRLWDSLLTPGFLIYTFFAGLLATALVARLRMLRPAVSWDYALGTGLLGYLTSASCAALSLVPLALLLLCQHCAVRLMLFIVLNVLAWFYMGYYTLGDLGPRPRGVMLALKATGWGLVMYVATYAIFFVLILCVIPI